MRTDTVFYSVGFGLPWAHMKDLYALVPNGIARAAVIGRPTVSTAIAQPLWWVHRLHISCNRCMMTYKAAGQSVAVNRP